MSIFLISDMHLDHANIIRHCNRPFQSVVEMNHHLVYNWNEVVTDSDTVFHVGDFCHGNPQWWIDMLNGRIEFIRGNHDRQLNLIRESLTLLHNGEEFLLTHYPPVKPGENWTIHGHTHNNDLVNYPLVNPALKSMNVGVEVIGYEPVLLDDLLRTRDGTIAKALSLKKK